MNETYKFNFPPMEKAGTWDMELKHAAGELIEARGALDEMEAAMEIMDVIECCENALRAVLRNNASELATVYQTHHYKNEVRGYYG